MTYETILFEVKDQVAIITLNRPEAANGLIMTSGKELMHAAIRCDEDPGIRRPCSPGAASSSARGAI